MICEQTGKIGYNRSGGAMQGALNTEKRRPREGATFEGVGIWKCDWCGHFHWGHTHTQERRERVMENRWYSV